MSHLKDPAKALKESHRLLTEIAQLDNYLFTEAHAADVDFGTDVLIHLEKARKAAVALVDKLTNQVKPVAALGCKVKELSHA